MRTLGHFGPFGNVSVDDTDFGSESEGDSETVEARTQIGRRGRYRNLQLFDTAIRPSRTLAAAPLSIE
jgi:hypothetical protein